MQHIQIFGIYIISFTVIFFHIIPMKYLNCMHIVIIKNIFTKFVQNFLLTETSNRGILKWK